MERLYYQNPYVKSFEAVVESCTERKGGTYEVVLNRTAFYPEGGGQPFDLGTLGTAKVTAVHERDGVIYHETDVYCKPGDTLTGILDWERRYSYMQQHSGEHLLSGLIHKHYGYDNVGFHMGREEITIDFNGILTPEQVEELELEANRMIYANLSITETYPLPEELAHLPYRSKKALTGQVRIIEIPGGDLCACCGTHVARTGEIGMIKIVGMIHYKTGIRMSLLCGKQALLDYGKKQKQADAISRMLSAKPGLLAEAVERLKQENLAKEMQINQLYRQLFLTQSQQLDDDLGYLILFEEAWTPTALREFCTILYEQNKGKVVLVCSGKGETYQYALGSRDEDMRVCSKMLNRLLDGRGGGSAQMAQGTFHASAEQITHIYREQEEAQWI